MNYTRSEKIITFWMNKILTFKYIILIPQMAKDLNLSTEEIHDVLYGLKVDWTIFKKMFKYIYNKNTLKARIYLSQVKNRKSMESYLEEYGRQYENMG